MNPYTIDEVIKSFSTHSGKKSHDLELDYQQENTDALPLISVEERRWLYSGKYIGLECNHLFQENKGLT